MKKSSILRFTRKCLKAAYKEDVCRKAWVFGATPTEELQKMYRAAFKDEKTFTWPHPMKARKTMKYSKAPTKITKAMILKAAGQRFV